MSKRLFIGNLPYTIDEAGLKELFSEVGTVTECTLITDRDSGRSKGFAFVEFDSDEEADKAIEKFNDHEIDGRKMIVNVARPKEERGPRDFGRNRGFSDRDRGPRRDSRGSRGGRY